MKRAALTTLFWALATALAVPASASSPGGRALLCGRIGSFPIGVSLRNEGGKLTGWYFYASRGKQIGLNGYMGPGGAFRMEETSEGKKTGVFEGAAKDGRWTGTWKGTGSGAALALKLEEDCGKPESLSGVYDCSTKERHREEGFEYEWKLRMEIIKGEVARFEAMQGVFWDAGNFWVCQAEPGDAQRDGSGKGIGLRPAGSLSDLEHLGGCLIRIMGNGDFLWVVLADPLGRGDNCRLYCGVRASWMDMVIDRGAGKGCRAVRE